MIAAAKAAELEPRPVIRNAQIKVERHSHNKAIQSRKEIQTAVSLYNLPSNKLEQYDTFPLMSQLGFLHAIPEDQLDISTATITDVGFLGLFPKRKLQVIHQYEKGIQENTTTEIAEPTFSILLNELISEFVYRPIMMEKIIYVLIAGKREELNALNNDQNSMTTNTSATTIHNEAATNTPIHSNIEPQRIIVTQRQRKCYATKCRILQAQGIIRSTMRCVANRNMCHGCSLEQINWNTDASLLPFKDFEASCLAYQLYLKRLGTILFLELPDFWLMA